MSAQGYYQGDQAPQYPQQAYGPPQGYGQPQQYGGPPQQMHYPPQGVLLIDSFSNHNDRSRVLDFNDLLTASVLRRPLFSTVDHVPDSHTCLVSTNFSLSCTSSVIGRSRFER
ncbi:hypothetical protein CC78DRAFT_131728 [Lojkania enalia]|uniref:Uncharacterized protein n=1 Tax=Lojkania enalia TaxID=147567 RepID=A0A9P4TQ57_9PLEO|nr:hypothetical protein CC78DRAFT_131728 [Didymosphaeria enalia]